MIGALIIGWLFACFVVGAWAVVYSIPLPASDDTLPKGQDAKQGLAGTESGAVGSEADETPNLQHPHQDTSGVSNHG
jgi:hypothetical protein